ncbi:MAG TPA: hypothetical protein VE686_03725, partial [Beijerinckiaceae bacterium]|nr:hypothetical protein [Beijerinckiaceae bacterium]
MRAAGHRLTTRAARSNGRVEQARPGLGRRTAAEGLAAFALVFAGCGAIVANVQYDGAVGAVGPAVAIAIGGTVGLDA